MKRRVRIPDGLDAQGRHTPGEIIEFDEEPPRGTDGWGPLIAVYVVVCLVLLELAWGWA